MRDADVRRTQQELPAEESDENYKAVNERLCGLKKELRQAKSNFWSVYDFYTALGIEFPSNKIGYFRSTPAPAVAAESKNEAPVGQ